MSVRHDTTDDLGFYLYHRYGRGIDGLDLIHAADTLEKVREALEHGCKFQTDVAERQLGECLTECDRIRRLIAKQRAA